MRSETLSQDEGAGSSVSVNYYGNSPLWKKEDRGDFTNNKLILNLLLNPPLFDLSAGSQAESAQGNAPLYSGFGLRQADYLCCFVN